MTEFLVVVGVLVLSYSMLARRLDRFNLTAPMIFLVAGTLFFAVLSEITISDAAIRLVAELTLVVVLFHDASSVQLKQLRKDPWLPVRLLLIGFPLTVLATFGAVQWILPSVGVAGALLLAGSLSPTDAGLGGPTVMNPRVPGRIRRALSVESGLNDGLATPIVLVALAALLAEEGSEPPTILQVTFVPVALAVLLGSLGSLVVSWLIDRSRDGAFSTGRGRAVVILATPLVLWGVAELIGANGFVTAFVAGLVFGASSVCLRKDKEAPVLLETSADLLSYVIWFLAGELVVLTFRAGFDWRWLAIAVLALTLLRILPVWIGLIGSSLRAPSRLFIGWFGPRGLATIVFALLAAEELGHESSLMVDIIGVTSTTVLLSVIAHGVTAQPFVDRLPRWSDSHSSVSDRTRAQVRTRGRVAEPDL